MKAFDRATRERLVALAREDGLHPATYLAVVEVESSGRPFLSDGTPIALFEKHHFFRNLSGAERSRAVKEGLAHKGWKRGTQYKDQKTDAGRRAVIDRARAINVEAANKSCSWGVGQVMGFNARSLGYPSATAMVEAFGTVEGQVEGMVRFIRTNKLVAKLKRQDWAAFALGFNGRQYAAHNYHGKLRQAFGRWVAKVRVMETPVGDVKAAQGALKANGYHEVGKVDGEAGRRTAGAIAAVQKANNLPMTGELDEATEDAIVEAPPAPLREGKPTGSRIVAKAKAIQASAVAAGGAAVAAATDDPLGAVEKAGSLLTRLREAYEPFAGVIDAVTSWGLPLAGAAGAAALAWLAHSIVRARTEDYQEGKTS